MLSLVERVAARHHMAAFIPDEFFTKKKAELKKLLAQKTGRPTEDVPWFINDRLIPLLKAFIAELIELAPQARDTLTDRLRARVDTFEKMAKNYFDLGRTLEIPYPVVSVLDEVLVHTSASVLGTKVEKAVPTLGKALTIQWHADGDKIREFIKSKLKKAAPETIDALLAHDDWSNRVLELKHTFYRTHIDKGVTRFLKKEKVTVDFAGWFEFIRDMLAANYAGEPKYSQFELNGMKVVIDDSTVTPKQHDLYVKYLDVAYHKLKKKKLGDAWYGTVFIECASCGGVNQNTGGGVGGHFNIQKDHVKIFLRPSASIVHVMTHELGHRYWFKSMTKAQRSKFEALVRTHKGPRPQGIVPNVIDPAQLDSPKHDVEEIAQKVGGVLDQFLRAAIPTSFRKVIDEFEDKLSKAGWDFGAAATIILRVVEPEGPDEKALYKDARKSIEAVTHRLGGSRYLRQALEDDVVALPDGTDYTEAFKAARKKYVEGAKELIAVAVATSYVYMDRSLQLHNEREHAKMTEAQRQRQTEWDQDPREIMPVSDYGRSNTDEAFAEVFAHYVMDWQMTAEQQASFKAVMNARDRTAAGVATRWLKRCRAEPWQTSPMIISSHSR